MAEAYLPTKWHLDLSSHFATTGMGRKLRGLCPFGGGGARSPSNSVAWAEAYLRTKLHLDPSSRLVTTGMAENLGEAVPLWERELGPHLTQFGEGRGLSPCQA